MERQSLGRARSERCRRADSISAQAAMPNCRNRCWNYGHAHGWATMAAPATFTFARLRTLSAAARSCIGPNRTRYSVVAPVLTGMTKASKPSARNSFANRCALAALEKLPNCTANPFVVGTLEEDASAAGADSSVRLLTEGAGGGSGRRTGSLVG